MSKAQVRQLVYTAMQACEEKKADDVAALELPQGSGAFTDYFVLCTGSNPRQIQAISDEVEQQLTKLGQQPNQREGYNQAEWVLLDYVDFVVHVFSQGARKFYDLERLWKSAKRWTTGEMGSSLKKRAASAKKKAASTPVRKAAAEARRASTSSRGRRAAKKKSSTAVKGTQKGR